MGNTTEISRLSRLTAILTFLQSKKMITATELAHKFEVSVRTIYRDIKALEKSGIPVYPIEGKGYSLVKGYSLPPIMFTEEEANALITAENLVAQNKDGSLIANHKKAITKVKAVLKQSSKEKAEILGDRVAYFQNFSQEITSNNLSSIQTAITHLTLTRIEYKSGAKNEITIREIEPQALYHTHENWILIAWCRLRNDFREFRLDRILQLTVLDKQFEDRKFNLMDYFNWVAERYKS